MALSTKVGSFQKATATGNQAVTGVGFTPKVVIFFYSITGSSVDTWATDALYHLGMMTATEQAVCSAISATGSNPDCGSASSNAKCIKTALNTGTIYWQAQFVSMDADGFTINWTTNTAFAVPIGYIALGGSDVQGAKIVEWTTPTTAIAKAVTGVGFQPDFAMHISIHNATAVTEVTTSGKIMCGVMDKAGEQWVDAYFADDPGGAGNSDTQTLLYNDACIGGPTTALGDSIRGAYTSMDADGFTTTLSVASGVAEKVWTLCIKGPDFKIGTINSPTSNGDVTATGGSAIPKLAFFSHVGQVASSSPAAGGFFGTGAWDGTSQKACSSYDTNGVNPAQTGGYFASAKVLTKGSGSMQVAATAAAGAGSNVTVSFNPVEATARRVGYLLVGPAAPNQQPYMTSRI